MRKYAKLREPLRRDEANCTEANCIYKVMLYETAEGFYLFEYDSPDALQCCADRCYESLADLYEDWNDLIDENGWVELEDPLPDCQHDAFVPLRIKDRNVGKPEWGKYEVLVDGKWTEYDPGQ